MCVAAHSPEWVSEYLLAVSTADQGRDTQAEFLASWVWLSSLRIPAVSTAMPGMVFSSELQQKQEIRSEEPHDVD